MTKEQIIRAIEILGHLLKGSKVDTKEPLALAMRAKLLELVNAL